MTHICDATFGCLSCAMPGLKMVLVLPNFSQITKPQHFTFAQVSRGLSIILGCVMRVLLKPRNVFPRCASLFSSWRFLKTKILEVCYCLVKYFSAFAKNTVLYHKTSYVNARASFWKRKGEEKLLHTHKRQYSLLDLHTGSFQFSTSSV